MLHFQIEFRGEIDLASHAELEEFGRDSEVSFNSIRAHGASASAMLPALFRFLCKNI